MTQLPRIYGAMPKVELVEHVCKLEAVNAKLLAACEYAYNYVSKLEGLRGENRRQRDACQQVLWSAFAKAKQEK